MAAEVLIQAFQVRTSWNRRVIRLTGEVEATVEFRTTLAAAAVRVDDKLVSSIYRGFLGGDESVHYFLLPSPAGVLQARLAVTYTLVGEVWKVILHVGGVVVYADEHYGMTVTAGAAAAPSLPIPASPPEPEAAGLPLPAAEPGIDPSGE